MASRETQIVELQKAPATETAKNRGAESIEAKKKKCAILEQKLIAALATDKGMQFAEDLDAVVTRCAELEAALAAEKAKDKGGEAAKNMDTLKKKLAEMAELLRLVLRQNTMWGRS